MRSRKTKMRINTKRRTYKRRNTKRRTYKRRNTKRRTYKRRNTKRRTYKRRNTRRDTRRNTKRNTRKNTRRNINYLEGGGVFDFFNKDKACNKCVESLKQGKMKGLKRKICYYRCKNNKNFQDAVKTQTKDLMKEKLPEILPEIKQQMQEKLPEIKEKIEEKYQDLKENNPDFLIAGEMKKTVQEGVDDMKEKIRERPHTVVSTTKSAYSDGKAQLGFLKGLRDVIKDDNNTEGFKEQIKFKEDVEKKKEGLKIDKTRSCIIENCGKITKPKKALKCQENCGKKYQEIYK